MRLQYRGIQYTRNAPPIITIPGETIGKYRGTVLKTQHSVMPPVCQRLVMLQYRGIYYHAQADHSLNTVRHLQPATPVQRDRIRQ
jgi:hypothetical protein